MAERWRVVRAFFHSEEQILQSVYRLLFCFFVFLLLSRPPSLIRFSDQVKKEIRSLEKSYSYSVVFLHTKKSLGIFSLTEAINEEQASTHSSGVVTRHTLPLHTMSTLSVIIQTRQKLCRFQANGSFITEVFSMLQMLNLLTVLIYQFLTKNVV